jgi:hypothetical protein
MNRSTGSLVAAILTITAWPAVAQWLNVPTKGIPRTKDGKPALFAPAPRKPDSKPDLSGVWLGDAQNTKYQENIAADFKPGEFPIKPWAEAFAKRVDYAIEAPGVNCLPPSIPILDAQRAYPFKIVQEPDLVVIFYEVISGFRQIFLDARTLAKDPNPTWLGYSVGRWEGDVLVVGTTGSNGKTLLHGAGHPSTEALYVIERFRRRDFGHLEIQLTIDDPKAYSKPWMVTLKRQLLTDTGLLEYICNENERDLKHIRGK